MANYRVKKIKRRPIDSRERLPSDVDAPNGKVFVFFGGSPSWREVSVNVVVLWAKRYTLYWCPTGRSA